MEKSAMKGYGITQIGFVVRDVDATAAQFRRLVGMEEAATVYTAEMDLDTWEYRGEQVGEEAKIKAFRFGNIEFEFIQPLGGKGTWHEYLEEKGEGIHHFAFKVKGMQDRLNDLAEAGYPLIQRGEMPGGRFAYVDGLDRIHSIVELLEFDDE